MNILIVTQRAVRIFNAACGRLPWRVCMQRAALFVRLEQRS